MEYSFHIYNKLATDGTTMATENILTRLSNGKNAKTKATGLCVAQKMPVIVCVGSDLAIGDSLGPITGSMLQYKTQGLGSFLYGTLAAPITAKEIGYMRSFLKESHKESPVITVDAAVGNEGDIGLIKILDTPLYPGAGANKKLGAMGDMSILGIVAEKSVSNYNLLNTTRLNLVYSMAEIISSALASLLWERSNQIQAQKNA